MIPLEHEGDVTPLRVLLHFNHDQNSSNKFLFTLGFIYLGDSINWFYQLPYATTKSRKTRIRFRPWECIRLPCRMLEFYSGTETKAQWPRPCRLCDVFAIKDRIHLPHRGTWRGRSVCTGVDQWAPSDQRLGVVQAQYPFRGSADISPPSQLPIGWMSTCLCSSVQFWMR